jgi:hypothetical protein
MGSRPLFWNLTSFPHSTGTVKNLIFWPCFGHEGCKSPLQTAFLRHSSPKNRLRRYIWGGFASNPPPQNPLYQRTFSNFPFQPINRTDCILVFFARLVTIAAYRSWLGLISMTLSVAAACALCIGTPLSLP